MAFATACHTVQKLGGHGRAVIYLISGPGLTGHLSHRQRERDGAREKDRERESVCERERERKGGKEGW